MFPSPFITNTLSIGNLVITLTILTQCAARLRLLFVSNPVLPYITSSVPLSITHNAPALSHTTWTDEADNWPFYMASWDRAQLWHIPMPYEWANVSSFTMQYWWLMERLSPSNISGLTHWYARSEWTVAKGPYAASIEAE